MFGSLHLVEEIWNPSLKSDRKSNLGSNFSMTVDVCCLMLNCYISTNHLTLSSHIGQMFSFNHSATFTRTYKQTKFHFTFALLVNDVCFHLAKSRECSHSRCFAVEEEKTFMQENHRHRNFRINFRINFHFFLLIFHKNWLFK